MNFLDEFADKLGFEKGLLKGGFKFLCFSFSSVLIEGHKGIVKYSSDEMQFSVKSGTICVFGENLKIKNFSKFSVLITGKIRKTEFLPK